MEFYVTLFIAVAGIVLGAVIGGFIVIYMIHANEGFINRRKKKYEERSRKNRKKKAERKEIQRKKKQDKKPLKDKLINQDLTYADLLDSVDEESTEEEIILENRRMQDYSYNIVQNRQ